MRVGPIGFVEKILAPQRDLHVRLAVQRIGEASFEKAVGLLACRRLIQGLAAKKHIVLPPPSRVKAEISITERSTVFSANGILPIGHRTRIVGTVGTISPNETGIFGMRPGVART